MVFPIYLVVVELGGDTDRKRLEYVLEKWSGVEELSIRKLCAGVLLVDGGPAEMLKFVDDLLSKFSREVVRVWSLSEPDFVVQPLVFERSFRVAEGFEDVWGVVSFVMSKFKGVLVSESALGLSRVYRVRSRYGVATVRFDLFKLDDGSRVLRVRVEGYGAATPHVFDRLIKEISYIESGTE